jgi:hypothetical protein
MRITSCFLVLPLLACGGTSSQSAAASPAAPATAAEATQPCNVPVAVGESWRLVDAGDFTFCVPVAWRVRPTRAVHAGGSIEWKRGVPSKTAFTVMRVGSRRGAPPSPPGPAGRNERRTEVIAGRPVEVWRMPWEGKLATGATWTDPAMHFTGTANTEDIATVQLAVYRTVRFADR